MKYHNIVKYTHLLLVAPLLLYVGCKGLGKEKINKYLYVLLMILAVNAFAVHSGLINIRQYFEKFQSTTNIVKGSNYDSIFSTGTLDRRDKRWFQPRTHNVEIIDFEFKPKFINVMKGDTVKWFNRDPQSHTVNSYTDLFSSKELKLNETFEYTFKTQGVFNYLCDNHPYSKGSITVATTGHHPNVQDIDMNKGWNPYINPLNQADAF
jgi:plastocyanin